MGVGRDEDEDEEEDARLMKVECRNPCHYNTRFVSLGVLSLSKKKKTLH